MAVLKKGSKGNEVKKLQASLNKQKAKPPLAEDGIFGLKTLTAVKAFQKKVKLKPDGLVGKLTLAAFVAGGPKPEIKVEDYKNKTAHYKKYRAYTVEIIAGFMRIRKAVDILENDINQVIFEAVKLSEANSEHYDKIFTLSDEIAAIQRDFEKLWLNDPKMAQKLADKCVTNDKEILSIGSTKIGPNLDKIYAILRSVKKTLDSSLATINAESKTIMKNQANFKN